MPTSALRQNLLCHPATPAPVVRTIETQTSWQPDGTLVITYCVWGDMARLRVPPPSLAEPADLLWEHTCFEAFVGVPRESTYREFNFSPSGQWATYAFSDYRQRIEESLASAAPRIATQHFAGHLELQATLASENLPFATSQLEIGLSAVIEATDVVEGFHSYWALNHPASRPDFHHRASFALTLNMPATLA